MDITPIIFEHACKENCKRVIQNILNDDHFTSNVSCAEWAKDIQPVFMLIYLLKKLHKLENFAFEEEDLRHGNVISPVIELLESTYKQYNFMSIKKYFTFASELKLLDLLNLIVLMVGENDSSDVVKKLNHHFPRWTDSYKTSIAKSYSIENSKVLDKVEESHSQCRRLIFKLAVDQKYKARYMAEEYTNDLSRLVKESKNYIKEAFTTLESYAGLSALEKMASSENSCIYTHPTTQLLLEYVQPQITEDGLMRYLDDLGTTQNSQPTSGLTSCLLPFDSLSEKDEDSEDSQSDFESSEDDESMNTLSNTMPSAISNTTGSETMDVDKND